MAEKTGYAFDTGPVAMAIILAAVLFSSAFYFSPSKSLPSQQEAQPHTIYVSADSSREVAPDKVEITFSVYSKGTDPNAIQAENDAKIQKARAAMLAMGVPAENIKTVGYSLDRWYDYNKTEQLDSTGKPITEYVQMGYQLTNSLRVVSYNVSQAGAIVKAAVANGANDVSGISFSLADSTQKKLYNSLLQEAAASAKGKAESMASSAGVQVKGLSSMSEGYNYVAPMANYNYRDAVAGSSGSAAPEVSISAGLVKVTATVSAQYEIAG
ncbi:Uncharacterised protein [uncultured archaeon]|nr:Uncharacterised protein [uncultured archaeon]